MKKGKNNPEKLSEELLKKYKDEKPGKRQPKPDDPGKENEPTGNEKPITGGPNYEEILGRTPK